MTRAEEGADAAAALAGGTLRGRLRDGAAAGDAMGGVRLTGSSGHWAERDYQ